MPWEPPRDGVLLEGWYSPSDPLAVGRTCVQWVLQRCSHTKQLCQVDVWVGEELACAWAGP